MRAAAEGDLNTLEGVSCRPTEPLSRLVGAEAIEQVIEARLSGLCGDRAGIALMAPVVAQFGESDGAHADVGVERGDREAPQALRAADARVEGSAVGLHEHEVVRLDARHRRAR